MHSELTLSVALSLFCTAMNLQIPFDILALSKDDEEILVMAARYLSFRPQAPTTNKPAQFWLIVMWKLSKACFVVIDYD